VGSRGAKDSIRREVWDRLLKSGVARFPLPPHGRIPNFEGAEEAAARLALMRVFRDAEVVKVNPDSPQRHVRYTALAMGKVVVMPTPRIREGFIVINPKAVPRGRLGEASTIRGAFRWGRRVGLREIPAIDLVVAGSVAVDRWGGRLGKGEGYSEIEYGILRSLGLVSEETPVVTTVHDLQVVNARIPRDPWDFTVDLIVTPTRVIKTLERQRPPGVMWGYLSSRKLEEIPALKELRRLLRS